MLLNDIKSKDCYLVVAKVDLKLLFRKTNYLEDFSLLMKDEDLRANPLNWRILLQFCFFNFCRGSNFGICVLCATHSSLRCVKLKKNRFFSLVSSLL